MPETAGDGSVLIRAARLGRMTPVSCNAGFLLLLRSSRTQLQLVNLKSEKEDAVSMRGTITDEVRQCARYV
jgi:hypothetical protein